MQGEGKNFGQIEQTLAFIGDNLNTIHSVSLGTGASRHEDGRFEAEVIHDELTRLVDEGPNYSPERAANRGSRFNKECFSLEASNLVMGANLDTVSQNTVEELREVVQQMKDLGLTEFVGVTSPFHGPRCMSEAIKAFEGSGIRVCIVVSESCIESATNDAATCFELPHRLDDPLSNAGINMNKLMGRFFRCADKVATAQDLSLFFTEHGG